MDRRISKERCFRVECSISYSRLFRQPESSDISMATKCLIILCTNEDVTPYNFIDTYHCSFTQPYHFQLGSAPRLLLLILHPKSFLIKMQNGGNRKMEHVLSGRLPRIMQRLPANVPLVSTFVEMHNNPIWEGGMTIIIFHAGELVTQGSALSKKSAATRRPGGPVRKTGSRNAPGIGFGLRLVTGERGRLKSLSQ